MSETPNKNDLPKALLRVLNTLTDEAQSAAARKSSELGFDPGRGRVTLDETLINLAQARNILIDALECTVSGGGTKFDQLPLSLQFVIYEQVSAVARELAELTQGTDAGVNLETAVEALHASVWQFRLHDLSDQVLGFSAKMNQLKHQEAAIRQATGAAADLAAVSEKAQGHLELIDRRANAIADEEAKTAELLEQVQARADQAAKTEQAIAATAHQLDQQTSTVTQQLANAKQAVADIQAIATKAKELRSEIDAARVALEELTAQSRQLLARTETTAKSQREEEAREYAGLLAKHTGDITALREETAAELTELRAALTSQVTSLVEATDARLARDASDQRTAFRSAAEAFESESAESLESSRSIWSEFIEKGKADEKRLVDELGELEGRIRDAIERATGYTLFHAFQKRQVDLAQARVRWGIALAVCVVVSLCASGLFIYSLQYVTEYDAAFYLKLSISIPLVYAIAFCNMQYARERKLEEEYAFKSSVSISLDPYQKLVAGLVDKTHPEERAKHTAFVIESVSRVFTSPTESVFEGGRGDRNYTERIIKAVGGVVKPLAQGLKR